MVEHFFGKEEVSPVRSWFRAPQPKGVSYAKRKRGSDTLKIVGKTPEGKDVIQGVFKLVSSLTGLPLENILLLMKKHDMVVDWLDFYEQCLKNNWNPNRTLERIRLSVREVYGDEHSEETMKRLKFCLTQKESQHVNQGVSLSPSL